jgi:hypothetical protein
VVNVLDLAMEELEPLDAPGFGEWGLGVGIGTVAGGGLLYAGIAIT